MKSDALSADELADLNKKLQETLKAQVAYSVYIFATSKLIEDRGQHEK